MENDESIVQLQLTEHCPTCAERDHVVGVGALKTQ
jgi:hypothetical protein